MRKTGNDDGHVRTLLGAFLLGGLSAYEESAVRAHLSVCAECRAEHDYLACVPRWLDLVRGSAADDDPVTDADDQGAARPVLRAVEPQSTAEPGVGS